MFTGQRHAVHFIAEQRLRMRRGEHVERLVIIIRAFDGQKARGGVGANHLEKVGDTNTTELPNHVPSLHADMPRDLRELR